MKLFFLAVSFFSSVKSAHFRNIDPAGYPKRRSFDAKILLPPAEELKKSFVTIKLEDFIEKTGIDQKLGGRTVYPFTVIANIEIACYLYNKSEKNYLLHEIMLMRKPEIIEIFFDKYPKELAMLEAEGLLPYQ